MAKLKDAKLKDLVFDNKNFNKHTEFGMSLIEKSLRNNGAGRSILIDKNNRIIAGNGVTEVAGQIGLDDVQIVETDGTKIIAVKRTDIDLDTKQGREMALADNATGAADLQWDAEAIADVESEFDIDASAWGVSLDFMPLDDEGEDEEENESTPHDNAEAERLLDDAMRENVSELVDRIDYTMKQGWLMSDLTLGVVKANFIKSKYYGAKYRGVNSLYFCPNRFFTSAKTTDVMSQLRAIKSGGKAGIAGCRTLSSDGYLLRAMLGSGGYLIGGARLPLDFPANKAETLYNEFSPEGRKPDVLDPCHGWGGRLVGALLADVNSYVGIDPSPVAHKGVERTYYAFKDYTETKNVQLIQKCFEDVKLEDESFDIALTSPPYFDVEQYEGDKTSHIRYNKYDKWVEGFYKPLIANTYKALREGGVFVLQVGSQSYPLEKDGKMIAKEVGFVCEDVRVFTNKENNNLHSTKENGEVIIILRKGA